MGDKNLNISLEASDFTKELVLEDAKKYGFNTVSAYAQYLFKNSHNNLYNNRKALLLKMALLLDTVLICIIVIILILRF